MTTPMPAFSGGCHTNKAVDDAYAVGGFPAVFKLPGGIYSARDAGCRAFIDRFPGTRYGDGNPNIVDFLECERDDWVQVVKSLTAFSINPFRKRCAYVAYLRGLSDFIQDTETDKKYARSFVRRIIALLRRAGARAMVEGTPRNAFEWELLNMLIDAGLYAGTEPGWSKVATELFKYPCLIEELAFPDHGASIDGSVWPSNWRPFGRYDPAMMLLLSDRVPMTPSRVSAAEAHGWKALPYCHQWAAAVGVHS